MTEPISLKNAKNVIKIQTNQPIPRNTKSKFVLRVSRKDKIEDNKRKLLDDAIQIKKKTRLK